MSEKYQLSLVVDDKDIYDCLLIDNVEKNRSLIEVKKDKDKLKVNITAKDATALRASFDSLVKLIITYEKMKNGVK